MPRVTQQASGRAGIRTQPSVLLSLEEAGGEKGGDGLFAENLGVPKPFLHMSWFNQHSGPGKGHKEPLTVTQG